MTPVSQLSALERASRNARTLLWWADCEPGFRRAARALYAQSLGCPDWELGDEDDFARDPDVLDHLSTHYANTIAGWEDDQL